MGFKKLIKRYDFTQRLRKDLTFSDKTKIRLNDDNKLDQGLTLKEPYDTDLDHTVVVPQFKPKRMKRWIGFEANEELPENTSVGYRLIVDDGATELYWDGSNWSAATLDAHYNDFKTINTNIAAYQPTDFDISIKVNLRTTDGENTPKVRWIKLLVELMFEPWDDLIYDTVIGHLNDNLRATTAIEFAVVATTSSIDLQSSDYKLENVGYNFTNVIAAYNVDDDPNQFINIASSYTPGAVRPDGTFEDGVINLSSPITAGKIIRLELEYVPEIAVFTNQEYIEPERLPAIVFERIASVRLKDGTDQERNDKEGDFVRNFDDHTAVEVPNPRQSTVRFEFAIWGNGFDLARLSDSIDKWMGG